MSSPEKNTITDVPLSPAEESISITDVDLNEGESTDVTKTSTVKVEDVKEGDEDEGNDDVNALLDELQEPSEQQEAMLKLRKSTSRLTSALKTVSTDIDSKLNISASAKNVDQTLGVTQAAQAIGGWFSSLNVGQKAQDLVPKESVKQASTTITGTLETTGVKDVWVKETKRVQSFDKEHRISTQTMEAVATGLDWVTNNIGTGQKTDDTDYESMVAVTEEKK